jgi:hypothetical protein
MPRKWTVGVLVALTASCGQSRRASDAVEIPPLDATLALRVGSAEDSATAFTWFRSLVVGSDGAVYTLHPMESTIRVHDSAGRFLRNIGRPGEGPGEFKNVGEMGWVHDSLWVLDFGTYRLTYFDAGGRLLRSVPVPIDLGRMPDVRPPRPTGLFADGSIRAAPPAWSRLVASGEIREAVILRMTSDGAAGDTVATYPLTNGTLEIALPNDPRARAMYGSQPFADGELVKVFPGELAFVRLARRAPPDGPAMARLTKITFAGDTVFAISVPGARLPIPEATVDSIVEERAHSAQEFLSDVPAGRLQEIVRERLYNPGRYPLFEDLVAGSDGSVWLGRPAPGAAERTWVVVRPDGSIEGEVALPPRLRLMWARLGRVWGMELDWLDVPYIVSYTVN